MSDVIFRNRKQFGDAVLKKANEILTDDGKTLQTKLNETDTDLNDLKESLNELFVEVKGNTGALNENIEINLPSGFSADNTYVISYAVYASSAWRTYGMVDTIICSVHISNDNKLVVRARTSVGANIPFKVLLKKI